MFAEPALFFAPEPYASGIPKRSPRARNEHERKQTPKTAPLDQKPGPQPPATPPSTEAYRKTAQLPEKRAPRTLPLYLLGRDDRNKSKGKRPPTKGHLAKSREISAQRKRSSPAAAVPC